jgi:short-subunit dehydrogenase
MDSHLCSITSLTSTRRGDRARLALVARREGSMHEVAAKARDADSPDVVVLAADVSNPEDFARHSSRPRLNIWANVSQN